MELTILSRLNSTKQRITNSYSISGGSSIWYARKVGYFVSNIYNFVPIVRDFKGTFRMPSEFKEIFLKTDECANIIWLAVLNSSLFNWFFTTHSDCRHLNKRDIESFQLYIYSIDSESRTRLANLAGKLMVRFRETSEVRTMAAPSGRLDVGTVFPRKATDIIKEIDGVLRRSLGLDHKELTFIGCYDSKYRIGVPTDGDDE